MNYVMLVCSEEAPVPPDADIENAPELEAWLEVEVRPFMIWER